MKESMKEKTQHHYIPKREARTFSLKEFDSFSSWTQHQLTAIQAYLLIINGTLIMDELIFQQSIELELGDTKGLTFPNRFNRPVSEIKNLPMTIDDYVGYWRWWCNTHKDSWMMKFGRELYERGILLEISDSR